MSVVHQTVRPGEWVKVPYPTHPLTPVSLAFDIGNSYPAFWDQGQALIRCPELSEGNYSLYALFGEEMPLVSKVKVTHARV